MIPYSRPDIDLSDIKAVVKVLNSRLITQGSVVSGFEKELCNKLGYTLKINS